MFPEREASSQHSLPGTGRYYFVLHLNFFSTYTELVPKKMSSLAVVFAEAEPGLGSEPKSHKPLLPRAGSAVLTASVVRRQEHH